jgi:capsular polysaccharide biosynthesis protein
MSREFSKKSFKKLIKKDKKIISILSLFSALTLCFLSFFPFHHTPSIAVKIHVNHTIMDRQN